MSSTNVLLYDPLRSFRTWNISQIWLGEQVSGGGYIVPNVNDLVIDWDVPGFYKVIYIDTTVNIPNTTPTYIPTLELIDFAHPNTGDGANGFTQRVDIYQPSILERAFLDTTVVPHTLSIDDRYYIYGTEAYTVKVFKGTDISAATGHVISQKYNGSGDLIGENIGLEYLMPNNPAVKRPLVIDVSESLLDGEIVTLVVYTQNGGPIGSHPFIVINSSAIRGTEANSISIVDIQLVSSMLDPVERDLLLVPANINITGGDFQARLIYSNGHTALIPVGTNKCMLHGVQNFNTSLAGIISQVVLTYYANANEPTINVSNPALRSISSVYRIRTVVNNLSHAFKIYVSPRFNTTTGLYENTYYLTNLDYTIFIKLTSDQITVQNQISGPVSYSDLSNAQTLRLSVLISDVIPFGFANYTHVQLVTIDYGSSSDNSTCWLIDYVGNNVNIYGSHLRFEYSPLGQFAIDITAGAVSLNNWLAKLWTPLHAIFDPTQALSAPTPTHFKLSYAEYVGPVKPISDWNVLHGNGLGHAWTNHDTVNVIWLHTTNVVDTYNTLGISPVMINAT